MLIHILQILILLGITALLVWVSLRYKIRQLEQSSAEASQNLVKTRSKYNYLLSKNGKYESETKEYTQQITDLQQGQFELQTKLEEAQREASTQQAKIDYLETYKQKVEEQNEKIRTTEQQVQEERANLRRIEFELITTQNELAEKNKMLNNQQNQTQDYSNLLTEISRLRKDNEIAVFQETELQNKLQHIEIERKQLYNKIHETTLQLTALQISTDSLGSYKKRYEELQQQHEQQKNEIDTLRKRNLQLIEKQQQLEDQLKQYRELNRDYKHIITTLGYDKEKFSGISLP